MAEHFDVDLWSPLFGDEILNEEGETVASFSPDTFSILPRPTRGDDSPSQSSTSTRDCDSSESGSVAETEAVTRKRKRERNKISASKYRQKRKEHLDSLENQVEELTAKVQEQNKEIAKLRLLKEQNEFLQKQNAFLQSLLQNYIPPPATAAAQSPTTPTTPNPPNTVPIPPQNPPISNSQPVNAFNSMLPYIPTGASFAFLACFLLLLGPDDAFQSQASALYTSSTRTSNRVLLAASFQECSLWLQGLIAMVRAVLSLVLHAGLLLFGATQLGLAGSSGYHSFMSALSIDREPDPSLKPAKATGSQPPRGAAG